MEELVRALARRGAYPLVRLSFTDLERVPFETVWAQEAPEELLEQPGSLDLRTRKEIDARVIVFSAENVFASSDLPTERRLALRRGARAAIDPETVVNSRYLINWGSNTSVTNSHLWAIMHEARKRGARIVTIDPYRSKTAARSDWWLPIRPGTDGRSIEEIWTLTCPGRTVPVTVARGETKAVSCP